MEKVNVPTWSDLIKKDPQDAKDVADTLQRCANRAEKEVSVSRASELLGLKKELEE